MLKSRLKYFLLINFLFNNIYSVISQVTPQAISGAQNLASSALSALATNLAQNSISDNNILNNNIKDKEINNKKIIKDIIVHGNSLISTDTILIKIPYRSGQIFDPGLTSKLIQNIYSLGYFDFIELKFEDLPDNFINLIIILKEKKKLESIIYQGNNNLTEEEIEKKYSFSKITTINQEEADLLAEQLKRLYREKNFNNVTIIPDLQLTENNTLILKFDIKEGNKAIIKRISFQGNSAFTGKRLRSLIFTKEDWILGALDRSGSFDPELIERDRHLIEYFYQSNGYFKAKVKDVKIDFNRKTDFIDLTFIIDEGELYRIGNIEVETHDKIAPEILLNALPIQSGQIYSRALLVQSIEVLRTIWGQSGYAYSQVNPIPIGNSQNNTVDIKFETDLGNQMFIDRINIIGNYRTRDYVIRRALALQEGELLTTQAMDISKARIESLGFFEPHDGVSWKINKISDNLAELNLIVKEIRTGKMYGQVGFGGADDKSALTGLKITAGISDRNFLGTGVKYNFNCSFSQEDRGVVFNIFQPYLFDKPIGAGFDAYLRKSLYDQFQNVADIPVENVTGFIGNISFHPVYMPDLMTIFNAGIENIHYNNKVIVEVPSHNPREKELFQSIVNRRFEDGTVSWVGLMTGQDLRNHPTYPSKGYNWSFTGKFSYPTPSSNFSFYKIDFDGTWLTPLIGDSDLIFLLHAHAGVAKPFYGKNIPYRELYHVGGPATVRGYFYGQIGPSIFGDSIGAQKAFWVNAELIFSATKDQSLRGVLFYDGGAGWDTPSGVKFQELGIQDILKNNRFKYRHSIGFGIRLASPPIRIDWGFKLDRNKKLNEPASEVHFNMAQDF